MAQEVRGSSSEFLSELIQVMDSGNWIRVRRCLRHLLSDPEVLYTTKNLKFSVKQYKIGVSSMAKMSNVLNLPRPLVWQLLQLVRENPEKYEDSVRVPSLTKFLEKLRVDTMHREHGRESGKQTKEDSELVYKILSFNENNNSKKKGKQTAIVKGANTNALSSNGKVITLEDVCKQQLVRILIRQMKETSIERRKRHTEVLQSHEKSREEFSLKQDTKRKSLKPNPNHPPALNLFSGKPMVVLTRSEDTTVEDLHEDKDNRNYEKFSGYETPMVNKKMLKDGPSDAEYVLRDSAHKKDDNQTREIPKKAHRVEKYPDLPMPKKEKISGKEAELSRLLEEKSDPVEKKTSSSEVEIVSLVPENWSQSGSALAYEFQSFSDELQKKIRETRDPTLKRGDDGSVVADASEIARHFHRTASLQHRRMKNEKLQAQKFRQQAKELARKLAGQMHHR